jgi:hypothetical protein
MKSLIFVSLLMGTLGASAIPGNQESSVLTAPAAYQQQEPTPAGQPVPVGSPLQQETAPSTVIEGSPSDLAAPPQDAAAPAFQGVVPAPPVYGPVAGAPCCDVCGHVNCCCTVPATFCITDPCDGCSYEFCAEVPTCCVGQQPVVQFRQGLLGRKIADVCWVCCDKEVRVVITARGAVRVHD